MSRRLGRGIVGLAAAAVLMAFVLAMSMVPASAAAARGADGSRGSASGPAATGTSPTVSPSPSPTVSPSPPPASTGPTQAEVQAFVDKAVKYAKEVGKEAALAAFTAPGGEFHQNGLYIFAYDFDGTVIAHGGDPSLVGKNLIDMHDPNGVPVIKDLVRLARGGSGWLYYTWADPAKGGEVQPKLGYVKKVDDTWFLGSGTYGAAAQKPPSRAAVKAFVNKAYRYVQKVGRKRAFAAFMDKGGPWFRGQLYVFADTFDGTVLCFPTEPDKVGANLWNRRDPDGVHPIRRMSRMAQKHGAGWVTYKYNNPAQGNQLQRKFTYVRRGGDGWFLGSGTYRPID